MDFINNFYMLIKKLEPACFSNRIYLELFSGKRKRLFFVRGLKVRFKGANSTIIFYENIPKMRKCLMRVGTNCNISIKPSKYLIKNLQIHATANNVICTIEKDFSLTDGCQILLHKENNLSVKIGEDCMFGSNIMLRTSDVHSIVNKNTNEVLNSGGNINIGNHCWLASNVTILKNVSIADNCVIGANSTVTKNCNESNCVYAGMPVKIVKKDINWLRETPKNILS